MTRMPETAPFFNSTDTKRCKKKGNKGVHSYLAGQPNTKHTAVLGVCTLMMETLKELTSLIWSLLHKHSFSTNSVPHAGEQQGLNQRAAPSPCSGCRCAAGWNLYQVSAREPGIYQGGYCALLALLTG